MTGRVEHTDVAAYSLGLLEAEDKHAFEEHLLQCPRCLEELRGLRGISALMHGLDKQLATPTPSQGTDDLHVLLRRCSETRHRRSRQRLLVAAAMLVVLPIGGGFVWSTLNSPDPSTGGRPATASPRAAELLSSGERFTGTSPTDVSATVAVEAKTWGTDVTLQITGVQGPLLCRLVALDHAGGEETVMSWQVAAPGKAASAAKPLVIQGSVATSRDQINRFEVRASDGEVLSTVPVE
ncbi:anti-sigma factor family protein [Actinomadura sp. HBU206391]|uniref:anti-sigma factor family protein n=1 Tax=Actinomadura sp. HBU206391 TaxID=2731692 RepID=UPI00164F372C|nr:zf-HC2 domain-containing protein [Actinomadura sp. HBU206391]MBC6462629.1 zf-HC2 domain-containing protein [Actinomadura sp. HBU206391]